MTQFAEDTKLLWKVINTLAGKMLLRQIGCTWQKLTVSNLMISAKANAEYCTCDEVNLWKRIGQKGGSILQQRNWESCQRG